MTQDTTPESELWDTAFQFAPPEQHRSLRELRKRMEASRERLSYVLVTLNDDLDTIRTRYEQMKKERDGYKAALEEIGRKGNVGPPDPPPHKEPWYDLAVRLGIIARRALSQEETP